MLYNIIIMSMNKYEKLRYDYLEYHDKLWEDTTYEAESSKTKTIVEYIQKAGGYAGKPFYVVLKDAGYKPYTIKALFQRAADMYEHSQKLGILSSFNNPYKDFLISNNHLFRNAYKTERLKIDFDEARSRINKELNYDKDLQSFCLALLKSGLRIHEAYKVDYDTASVIGKGGKRRYVNFEYKSDNPPTESRVRRALKKIGLKPHTLRKLLATKLSRSDMTYTDICEVMGWSSLETAARYLQPLKEEQLKQKLTEILEE